MRAFSVLALFLLAPPAAAAPRFEPAADAWGVHVRHHHGGSGEYYMVETMGSGVAVFDYDGDGDADLFFVDGGVLPGYEGAPPRSRLLRNDGGRFVDVTAGSGLVVAAYGMGATAGDVDGDGDLDLYVTAFGRNQLFANDGDGTFTDVTARAGVGDPLWSASAAFGDAEGDGDLDLYVTNYVDFTLDDNEICGVITRGVRSYCHPDVYDAEPDRFYLNRGDGTFDDATAEAGLGNARGKGLGVVWSDLDGDGAADLYVANDMTFNLHLENRSAGERVRFEDVALLMGTAVGELGKAEAGMGIAVTDVDGDARPEIYVTHLDRQTNALYAGRGAVFVDRRFESGLAEPTVFKVGFGAAFADFDHDGDADLAVANGHIIHNVEVHGTGTTYRQRNQIFENLGGGRFREVAGAGLDAVRVSRGLAVGDLDLDGDLDLVITNSNDVAEVYENVSGEAGAWLKLDLDVAASNRQGVGARVDLRAGELDQVREVATASSYLSQNDMTLHFGLGDEPRVDELDVRLAGGRSLSLRHLPRIRRLRLRFPR